jgi:hypothetical protein
VSWRTGGQDKKCSWLCVQALSRCTPEQRKLMQDNYGQHDEAKCGLPCRPACGAARPRRQNQLRAASKGLRGREGVSVQ